MTVAMVQIGVMDVLVTHWLMSMPVRMGLRHRPVVAMPMVLVMHVAMLVLEQLVRVFVIVPFRQMQPQANAHQQACGDELHRHRLTEKHQRNQGSDKRGQREICAGPGAAEVA